MRNFFHFRELKLQSFYLQLWLLGRAGILRVSISSKVCWADTWNWCGWNKFNPSTPDQQKTFIIFVKISLWRHWHIACRPGRRQFNPWSGLIWIQTYAIRWWPTAQLVGLNYGFNVKNTDFFQKYRHLVLNLRSQKYRYKCRKYRYANAPLFTLKNFK